MRRPDYFDLDRRLLQPMLPRLKLALRLVSGVDSGEAAWELLLAKGLLPAGWRDGGRRSFRVLAGEPHGEIPSAAWVDGAADLPFPSLPRVAAVVAAASGAMAAVEAQASLVARALEPWGQPRPRGFVWHVLPPRKPRQQQLRGGESVCEKLQLAAIFAAGALAPRGEPRWAASARLSSRPGRTAPQHVFARDVAMHEDWARAVEAKATVPCGPCWRLLDAEGLGALPVNAPAPLLGRPFAELPDPMSPLLAIWDAGCVLDALTPEAALLHLPFPALPLG